MHDGKNFSVVAPVLHAAHMVQKRLPPVAMEDIIPYNLVRVLEDSGPAVFVDSFYADMESPSLIWNQVLAPNRLFYGHHSLLMLPACVPLQNMRQSLVHYVKQHLAPFYQQFMASPSTVCYSQSASFGRMDYGHLTDEPRCGKYFLRYLLNREKWPTGFEINPVGEFLADAVDLLQQILLVGMSTNVDVFMLLDAIDIVWTRYPEDPAVRQFAHFITLLPCIAVSVQQQNIPLLERLLLLLESAARAGRQTSLDTLTRTPQAPETLCQVVGAITPIHDMFVRSLTILTG